jgi:ankyrin repeat protein
MSKSVVRHVKAADLAKWEEESNTIKQKQQATKEGANLTDLSIQDLFKIEPSWRGQRRKNLIAQGTADAAKEAQAKKGTGNQQLWEAARLGNFERLMDLLFRSKDYEPSSKDLSHGIHAAAVHGRDDIIELLIRHGADPGDNNMAQSFTPTMQAARAGHANSVLLLIDRGAHINAVNDLGQTALHLAATNGQAHVVKALVAEGADAWLEDRFHSHKHNT